MRLFICSLMELYTGAVTQLLGGTAGTLKKTIH